MRTQQYYKQKSKRISTPLAITIILIASYYIWFIASYINIIQHNMGSCDYAAWNLITKMF